MELFHNAKAVRLKGHHDKYLYAEEDEESVSQSRSGSSKNARWTLEFVDSQYIRLKSCYGKYLTASNQPFLLGMTGRKVFQTLPPRLDSSVEWEPVRDGSQVRLKTRYGHFLRANGGLPPWRNSVTHDIPHRTATQDWVLWDVDIVEIQVQSPSPKSPLPSAPSPSAPDASVFYPDSNSVFSEPSSPSSASVQSAKFSRQESNESTVSSPPKVDGRTIYYHIADENGEVEGEELDGYSMNFKGNSVEELTRRLEEETGIEDIIVCFRSPLNRKLYPLRLQLPPNNTIMHVVVVPSSATVAGDFGRAGIA